MKAKLYTLYIGLIIGINTQAQNFEWAYNMGGSGAAVARGVAIDRDGNVYTTGYFTGNSDFDQGTTSFTLNSSGSFGQYDIFIQKSDSNGNFVWAKKMGGNNHDRGYAIALDRDGNVLVTGEFQNTVDFDPSSATSNLISSIGRTDVFVLKLRPNGDFVWVKQIKAVNHSAGRSILTDEKGNVYTAGYFQGSNSDFDPGAGTFILHSGGTNDRAGFIQKLDSNGNFTWAKAFVRSISAGESVITSMQLSNSGHLYTTGYFTGRVDFNPNPGTTFFTSLGSNDIFIQKMDTAGNFDWAKSIGSTSDEVTNGLAVDWQDNVYTTGYFRAPLDFNPGAGVFSLSTNLAGTDPRDIFIQKLDSTGDFVWAKKMGARLSDISYAIATDAVGNIYNTGLYSETTDFDPGPGTAILTHSGSTDVYLQKLAPNGDFIWAKKIGAGNNDLGLALAIDSNYDIYTAGQFYGTADFDPGTGVSNLNSSSLQDAFVQRLSQCVPVKTIEIKNACNSLTWNGTTYFNSTNTPMHRLTSASGCDSLVFLNLTIDTVDKAVTVSGITLTASLAGATYQWVNCNTAYSAIAGATSRSYTPSTNGSYACIVNDGTCSDTSSCITINSTGIQHISFSPLSVYPNPVSDVLYIDLEPNSFVQVEILAVSGQVVKKITDVTSSVEVSELANGIYTLKVTTPTGIKIGKFVKR